MNNFEEKIEELNQKLKKIRDSKSKHRYESDAVEEQIKRLKFEEQTERLAPIVPVLEKLGFYKNPESDVNLRFHYTLKLEGASYTFYVHVMEFISRYGGKTLLLKTNNKLLPNNGYSYVGNNVEKSIKDALKVIKSNLKWLDSWQSDVNIEINDYKVYPD